MSERDLTSEEIQALEELADLAETDPAGYRQLLSEARTEAERREHGEALLSMFDNATQHRQEQDRAALEAIFRAESEEGGRE